MKFFWKKQQVDVRLEAANKINQAARQSPYTETGGLLIGWWDNQTIIIKDVVELDDPTATGTSWMRHEEVAQASLNEILEQTNDGLIGYVGDWHTHPLMIGASTTDISSLKRASRQYQYPIALVVRLPDESFDVHVALLGKHCKVNHIK